MRKFKLLAIISTFVLALGLMVAPVSAEEYVTIASYAEKFVPAEDGAATLTVDITATADAEGYIYLVKTLADTTYVSVEGENLAGELEEYTQGSINYYRVKVVDPSVETTFKATFNVPGFYSDELVAGDNGGSAYSLSYTFTNYLDSEIGKYSVTVCVDEEMEIVKVTNPAKYAKQKLGVEDGMRLVGASGKLAPAATSGVAFTYNYPTSSMMKIAVWVGCLAIGGFVFFDRFKKAR